MHCGLYMGPGETWRRFMAGLSVTPENTRDDVSLWVIRPMTRYHLARLGALMNPSDSRLCAGVAT